MSGGSAYPGSAFQRPLLPVDSCFGGLAIYRWVLYINDAKFILNSFQFSTPLNSCVVTKLGSIHYNLISS